MVTRPPSFYKKEPPPHNLTVCKGVKNVLLDRETAEFMLYSEVASDLYNWLQDAEVPEEAFYSTLVRVRSRMAHNGQAQFGTKV